MTYRLVPPHVWGRLQKVTLLVTAIIGFSLAVTPVERNVSTLSVIEQTMSADLWAVSMMVFSLTALALVIDMDRRKHDRWVNIVGYLHIALCSLLVGYSVAAFVGVLLRIWWNFGAPTLGGMLAWLHFIFIRKRPVIRKPPHADH